jgi:1-aminocyclopropane-1-carboxylate deaminase/D-cysteine desulfhydrase-like pyridoxal-dependent ACC family enzyme
VIGRYPTPVQLLAGLSTPRGELWIKRDDLTSDLYGGNKVRKLEHIFEEARAKGSRRLLTFGTGGSHQGPATAMHGRGAGFEVAAILTPQLRAGYAVDILRAGLAAGLEVLPASSVATAPFVFARARRRHDFVIGPGGSSLAGTMGYIDAALELGEQVKNGELPVPDAIVVPLGSAGTAAGLLVGLAALGLPTKVIGVRIVHPALMGRQRALWLALRAARRRGIAVGAAKLAGSFEMERGYLGRGYSYPTDRGDRATEKAAAEGVALDPTYTAKTFAAALDVVASGRFSRVLYWHTLSSVSLAPLLEGAPDLPREFECLFHDP